MRLLFASARRAGTSRAAEQEIFNASLLDCCRRRNCNFPSTPRRSARRGQEKQPGAAIGPRASQCSRVVGGPGGGAPPPDAYGSALERTARLLARAGHGTAGAATPARRGAVCSQRL